MSAVASILIGIAAKVGAPIVKGLLEQHLGGKAGQLGAAVIDAIAERSGVPVEQLETLPPQQLAVAVQEIETECPAILAAIVERQRQANDLMLAEMKKESSFGWMWRPAGMWLMIACIAWYVFVRPVLNAALWALSPGIQIEMGLDVATFLGIFTVYTGLYMGGNTWLRSGKK
jgi:hypothetical protein